MPDFFVVFSRWWKHIVAFTFLATALAGVVALLLPKKYIAIATALPASSFASDKSTIFNTNIQELYSALGNADDLDRIIGTARLDTIYIAIASELNLATHYGFDKLPDGAYKAAQKLKRNTTVAKSEWGELKIKVVDVDRDNAAQLCNGLLKKLQRLHQALQNQSNQLVLQKLKEAAQAFQQKDTAAQKPTTALAATQPEQAQVYEQLVAQYNLMVATNPPVLLVVEAARPPLYADNTGKWASVLLAFFAATLFSLLLALYTEGKKSST